MFRKSLVMGNQARVARPRAQSGGRTLAWVLAAAVVAIALGFASTSYTPAQDQQPPERPDRQERSDRVGDWASDNLDMVSAAPDQIRGVLVKDPGLMVELKRLMARQATERGQIVSERDLEDSAVLDRLETDTRFRAMATRLLQRYGYLSPQINPDSPAGKEQDLQLKARAERLTRESNRDTDRVPRSERSVAACGSQSEAQGCLTDESRSNRALSPGQQNLESPCDPNRDGAPYGATDDIPCLAPPERPGTTPNSAPARTPAPAPEQGPDELNPMLMTASAVSSSGAARSNSESDVSRSRDSNNSDINDTYMLRSDVSGGIPPVLPENPFTPPTPSMRRTSSRTRKNAAIAPEPVEMVSSTSPYSYLPSLYDLYMQAEPRTERLERFGLDVFHHNASSVGMPMDLPAGPDYVLGPGDGLTIDLWGGISSRMFRSVDREGRLSLPEAGPIQVTGKTLGEVQEVVQRTLRTQYRDVSADVSLARLRTVRVYVVGEVVSPGAYDISSLSTPLNALYAAGGITSRGSLRLLRHFRGRQLVEEVDAYDLLLHGVRGDLKNLENGDTLLVPPVGPEVSVDGMVRRPAVYELRGETNLGETLELAGGILPAAALRHIEVQRLAAHENRTMLSVDLDATSDPGAVRRELATFQVRDGDEIHIFPIAPYNTSAVYLQGHVLRPGRYAYTPGMRLTDLVASYKDLLPEPAEHYAEIVSLRQPDWRPVVESVDLSAALANPPASPKLSPLDTVRIFGRYDLESAPTVWVSGEVRSPGQYRTSGQMHLRDAIYQAGGLLPDAALDSAQLFRIQSNGSLRILNVNLAGALDADPLENVLLESRDRIIVHRSQYREDPPSVYIRGEVENPGRYPLGSNMRVTDLLLSAGGPKRSADLTTGDLTRYFPVTGGKKRGEHQTVNLIAALHNTHQDVMLKDGDVLSVPQLPGWKDLGASITLKGEIKNPGVYGIRPGERLSSVLKRAGGLLPTAYPQGAIFTRSSVRELQEKSKENLIQQVEQEGAAIKTSVATSGADQATYMAAAAQQQQRVLEALRRAPASGRLVIRMHPGLKGFENSSQDIEVRDGDSLEIPKQPGVVLVVGQVYNSNAITYVNGRNAGWYLAQSGGATQLADKHATFIIRADGEITSRHQGGWWSQEVLSSPVRPGDTIVVPERTMIGDARWKSIIAIAQIAEAGAITAAIVF